MAGFQPLRLTLAVIVVLLPTACFDYEARLDISPTGTVTARIHVEQPDWAAHPEWPGLPDTPDAHGQDLFPNTVTGLHAHFGSHIEVDRHSPTGKPSGFRGQFSRVEALNHSPVSYHLAFDRQGTYRFTVRIEARPGLAEAVSEAAEIEARRMTFLHPRRAEGIRRQAAQELGFVVSARMPGMIVESGDNHHFQTVHWRVPLSHFQEAHLAKLSVTGVLLPWERTLHRWAQPPHAVYPLLPLKRLGD